MPRKAEDTGWYREHQNGALFSACKAGDTETVRSILEKGADVNARDYHKHTPLHVACAHNYIDIARLLLEKGAWRRGTRTAGRLCTPHVPLAIPTSSACCLTTAHTSTRRTCRTALLCTARAFEASSVARLLLKAGADATMRDWGNSTPLDDLMSIFPDDTAREEILDLFRQYAPEAVMEAYCTKGSGEMKIGR